MGTRTVGPYRRLKLVMGLLVCALVLAHLRSGTTAEQGRVSERNQPRIEGSIFQPDLGPNQTRELFGQEYAEHADEIAKRITNEIGMLDLDRLFELFPRLKFVDQMRGGGVFTIGSWCMRICSMGGTMTAASVAASISCWGIRPGSG